MRTRHPLPKSPIGRCIYRWREKKGMSLNMVVEATGLAKGMLSKLETHANPNPCYHTLKSLAKGFGITTRDLLRDLGDWENPE